MKNKPTYAGKIKNEGSQYVEAPFPARKTSKAVVHKGEDLRTGKTDKK